MVGTVLLRRNPAATIVLPRPRRVLLGRPRGELCRTQSRDSVARSDRPTWGVDNTRDGLAWARHVARDRLASALTLRRQHEITAADLGPYPPSGVESAWSRSSATPVIVTLRPGCCGHRARTAVMSELGQKSE